MKFEELPVPILSSRAKPVQRGRALSERDVLLIKPKAFGDGEFELYLDDMAVTAALANKRAAVELDRALASGCATLARLANPAADGSAELQVAVFNGEQLEMEAVEIGVDEKTEEALGMSAPDAAEFLQKKCVLRHGGKKYFLISAGEAAKSYLESGSGEDGGSEPDAAAKNRRFAIIGSEIRFALAEKDKGFGSTIFLASKISQTKNLWKDRSLRLACGDLKFADWTAAGERSIFVKAQLDKLTRDNNSYLKKWDEFGDAEGELFLERARNVGKIALKIKEEKKDGTIIIDCAGINEVQKELLGDIDSLDAVKDEDLPPFLGNHGMAFHEYAQGVVDNNESFSGGKKPSKDRAGKISTLKIDGFNEASNELSLKAEAAPMGDWLIYSIAGEIAQIKRRRFARNNIQTGRSANPNLGLLIEENGEIPPARNAPKMKALTYFVEKKVFPKNRPTFKQESAIKIALNTPDIALIQGPPGTGKTTVIAAIVERLNQELNNSKGSSGTVLLSGFQHDAVENMVGRLSINGLPVPKFGQRSGDKENENWTKFENQLRDWCNGLAAKLRKRNPNICEAEAEKDLRTLCVQYIKSPTKSLAIKLLEKALSLPEHIFREEIRASLKKELTHLQNEENINGGLQLAKLKKIRNIRVTECGFADDGPYRAADAYYALENELDAGDKELLEGATRWLAVNGEPPFLEDLKKLKKRLLVKYAPQPVFRLEKSRDTVINLIDETLLDIRERGLASRDKKTNALAELLFELENNPVEIEDAIKDYCFAFAATCQQSVNAQMQKMKGVDSGERMEYEFVIVDEAARVSPRDLMIPMSQGKRIILVGDHRQLPQLLDEDVAKRMEKGDNVKENDWLNKSMFEYLFTERLPALEKKDGIQRIVTLDKQYRMHPLLGDFISRNFYERFSPKEKFTSGLDEKYFAHDLPGAEGKCAVWLDVPLSAGKPTRSGTSQTRPAEADAICEKLREWVDFDNKNSGGEKKPLSFGVISFYKAQCDLIRRKLSADKFIGALGEDRLRIGTVDSFQGMEFDVVFLSLVRTGSKSFGFLQLYNRLNVSMSRQKKLLVAAGDSSFFDTDSAREKVPGLADFLRLCREKGKVL